MPDVESLFLAALIDFIVRTAFPALGKRIVFLFKRMKSNNGDQQIERVRQICLALPETWEKISHGEPTWFVGKKVFAMFSNNHHNDGHVAVTLPAAIGIQEMLTKKSPKKFYRPPYVGVRGWIGIEVDGVSDKELALHIKEAWKLIAPEKLHVKV